MKNNAYQLLPKIKSPDDFRNFNNKQLNSLCAEIRDLIIKTVSQNGGHLASNLGVVELTVALHKSFHSPEDSIIFDVSHQCYAHKILTGRYDKFGTLRQNGGISGFTNPDESIHDVFKYGHSSTSISAALGLATAKKLKGNDSYTIAVIGDGALSSGLAYEGLNNAGHSGSKLIVVINDNKMSIAKNVGGIARHLASIRSFSSYHRFKGRFEKILLSIPFFGRRLRDFVFKTKKFFKNIVYHSNIFEDMGFNYYGPIDGHNLKELEHVFESSKISKRPAVVHIITKKGYGYIPAEEYPSSYHSTGKFKVKSGVDDFESDSYSVRFGKYLMEFAEKDNRICALTAAMGEGTGISCFKTRFRDRYFDVGIAEEHAVTFASGLAKGGMLPVFAVYSSFLQRAYDELIHDAALQKNPVIIAVDRAGIVGMDGETHQGIFDVSFLTSIPGITVYSPCSYSDIKISLKRALENKSGITAIRFPRGKEPKLFDEYSATENDFDIYGNSGSGNVIISYGRIFSNAYYAAKELGTENFKIIKLNKIFPIDFEALNKNISDESTVFFFEEAVCNGSVSELISSKLRNKCKTVSLPDEFITHSDTDTLLDKYNLSKDKIKDLLKKECRI